MYENLITRKDPGCVVFLLDRSDSMKQPWANSGGTLAEGAARELNNVLLELILASQNEPGKIGHYFDVGVFGYGIRPMAGGEGVESAWGGGLAGRTLVPLPELKENTLAVREVPSVDAGAPPTRVPIWVDSAHGYKTPMCEAVAVAGAHVFQWAQAHPDSFPPIVINITDGLVTDNGYEGANLLQWAERLMSIQTSDGPSLLFNVFLSPTPSYPQLFPNTADGLPAPGPELFNISSVLPPPMLDNARSLGAPMAPGARAFVFDADSKMLARALQIGTTPGRNQDRE
jgi:hypothetical protein